MQTFRMIGRSIRDAFKSVGRNFSLSVASITCITITLIIVAFAIILSTNVNNFTKSIEEDVSIVIFLDNDATKEDVAFVKEQLLLMDNVVKDDIEYKSKDVVRDEMMDSSETFEKVLSGWEDDENPLRDTYIVKVVEIEKIKQTANQIEVINKVNNVQYGEGVVEKLIDVFDIIQKVTTVAAIALILVTIFLIINTIKLTIFSRRTEISIMRLVGASNSRIKLPFVVEGIILGIIGSIIPIAITIWGYGALYKYFNGQIFTTLIKLIDPYPFIYLMSLLLLFIGIIVGMLGSAGAVRKYVKV